jgi:hypothetical protein
MRRDLQRRLAAKRAHLEAFERRDDGSEIARVLIKIARQNVERLEEHERRIGCHYDAPAAAAALAPKSAGGAQARVNDGIVKGFLRAITRFIRERRAIA